MGAVTRTGEVFSFGDNTYGQLGFARPHGSHGTVNGGINTFTGAGSPERPRAVLTDADSGHSPTPEIARLWTPVRIPGLELYRICAASTAEKHSLLLAT